MAPDAFSSWKYLHSAHVVGCLNSVLMERAKKQVDLERFQFFSSSIRKVRCENLYSQSFFFFFSFFFFYELKLYLLIRGQRPSARGSVLGLNQLSCSLCCLPLETPSALQPPISGSQGNTRRTQLLLLIISFSVQGVAVARVLLPGHYWASSPSLNQTRSGSQFSCHPI